MFFGDKKKRGGMPLIAIAIKKNPIKPKEDNEEMLNTASREILEAVSQQDTSALTTAMKNFIEMAMNKDNPHDY